MGEEYGDEVFSFFLHPMDTINGIRNGGLWIIEYCVYHFLSSDTDAACCCLFCVFILCFFFLRDLFLFNKKNRVKMNGRVTSLSQNSWGTSLCWLDVLGWCILVFRPTFFTLSNVALPRVRVLRMDRPASFPPCPSTPYPLIYLSTYLPTRYQVSDEVPRMWTSESISLSTNYQEYKLINQLPINRSPRTYKSINQSVNQSINQST